ncbi:MAG: TetR/AcrR family transcriptional regulator [Sphingobium sp.]
MATKPNTPPVGARKKRATPGRPEGPSTVRTEILDAAEEKFAEYGFAGTSLRDISEQAGVTQALVNYYFGSKHSLFVEVYLRRGRVVADRRMANLAALRERADAFGVADILHDYLAPGFELRGSPGGRAFLRLQARLHTEPMVYAYDIRRQTYDESTRAYATLLGEHLPHLSERTIYWRLVQTIGAYLYLISDAHRIQELTAGAVQVRDDAETLRQLVAFVAGGFTAPES